MYYPWLMSLRGCEPFLYGEIKMNEDEIKDLIKQYIKDNLYVGIEATSESYYESAAVSVKVYLEGEVIAQDWSTL